MIHILNNKLIRSIIEILIIPRPNEVKHKVKQLLNKRLYSNGSLHILFYIVNIF